MVANCYHKATIRPLARATRRDGIRAAPGTPSPTPAERRKLLASLFDHIWQDNGQIVADKPRPAFAPYSKAIDEAKP